MLCTVVNCSGHIDRSSERCGDESRRCHQIDGKQCAFSGHAHDRRNPVDLEKPATDILMSYLTQVEPSWVTKVIRCAFWSRPLECAGMQSFLAQVVITSALFEMASVFGLMARFIEVPPTY